jgi:hypothetical protein
MFLKIEFIFYFDKQSSTYGYICLQQFIFIDILVYLDIHNNNLEVNNSH